MFSDTKKTVREGRHRPKSEARSLDDAITNLVKGLKRDLRKKYGRVDYHRLRKKGFSDYLLMRLKRV